MSEVKTQQQGVIHPELIIDEAMYRIGVNVAEKLYLKHYGLGRFRDMVDTTEYLFTRSVVVPFVSGKTYSLSADLASPIHWVEGIMQLSLLWGNVPVLELGVSAFSETDLMVLRIQRHRLDHGTRKKAAQIAKRLQPDDSLRQQYVQGQTWYSKFSSSRNVSSEAYGLYVLSNTLSSQIQTLWFPPVQYQLACALENMTEHELTGADPRPYERKASHLAQRADFHLLCQQLGIHYDQYLTADIAGNLFGIDRTELRGTFESR